MRPRVLYMVPALWCLATPSLAAGSSVAAAESYVALGAGFVHSAYSAHLSGGDDAPGFTPALTISAAALFPADAGYDYYTALSYRFSGGGGNVFNFAEARLGGGIPLANGAEVMPYVAIGYQGWNRTRASAGTYYASPVAGAGARFDLPVTNRLVVSMGAEFLALAGGTVSGENFAQTTMGITPEERVELGLDGAAYGPLHVFAQAWLSHFTYAGTQAPAGASAPFSTTTQTGVNLGIGYSFY